MYLRNRRLLSTIVLSMLWCSVCWPQDIAFDFQQAVQAVQEEAGGHLAHLMGLNVVVEG